ncbi:KamA family radical SAM protein [Streptomyces sp. NRRL S-340]|uniref:KamA family radical SAM protein n=1 Tax=Streptomyces sp. NRRL S-340 TaxID=1463901 RepID=UPI00068DE361|nr:lysine 2,3-aminomutase [Streptomyces sp. NRRL S-340]
MPHQPYAYRRKELTEPDWRRIPGWREVTPEQWRDPQWQRVHCVKNVRQLKAVYGDLLSDGFCRDLERDQAERATMSLLLPPYVLSMMVPDDVPDTETMYADPVRRHMMPVFSDRDPEWPSHPYASRDSLHEAEMWTAEGLTHRYPTKVLAELVSTCPQYCGHCTRMDLVGNSTPQISKMRFSVKQPDRYAAMLDYLRRTPTVRDVVVSGGDVANVPWPRLESFVSALLELDHIRDIRLASKALMDLPQHWLSDEARRTVSTLAETARKRGVSLAVHTHVNSAQQVTRLNAEAARTLFDLGVRDVRNQGVLMRGVNDTSQRLLDLCFALLDGAGVMPYYFYLCDMIPNAEHWRVSLGEAQQLQQAIMGYLPGFATPRLVCDVPFVGKRWVHQVDHYDRERGISYWTKNYLTSIEQDDPYALARTHEYYDPIQTLRPEGRQWWRRHGRSPAGAAAAGRPSVAVAQGEAQ